jgi:hypothetical protein
VFGYLFSPRLSANAETLSPDEEIHRILNMYLPEELGEKAEKYLMNLRTDIYDVCSCLKTRFSFFVESILTTVLYWRYI